LAAGMLPKYHDTRSAIGFPRFARHLHAALFLASRWKHFLPEFTKRSTERPPRGRKSCGRSLRRGKNAVGGPASPPASCVGFASRTAYPAMTKGDIRSDLNCERMLALHVLHSHFGFAVFEGPNALLDWGVKSFRGGVNAVKISPVRKLAMLLSEFVPHVIVTNKPLATRPHKINTTILEQARAQRIPVRLLSRTAVQKTFPEHTRNKHEIATLIADRFPRELSARLPAKRKIWQSEDYRMSIFAAVALGLAYFSHPSSRLEETSRVLPSASH